MITDRAVVLISYIGDIRETINKPAVTMVAAWINAEIGVGPSIESGSQTCNGNCADLPIAPTNSSKQVTVIKSVPKNATPAAFGKYANTS